jgi:hypothetical protein
MNFIKQTQRSTWACLAALPLVIIAAPTQAAPWTTVGSTGVVDDGDLALFDFVGAEARIKSTGPAGSVLNLRYNVVALEGFTGLNQGYWRVRFRDNGTGARVRLQLRQANTTGTTSTLATFDSNTYPAQVGYQTQAECIALSWDFADGPFFIDAELTKSSAAGVPAVSAIIIDNGPCQP